MDLRAMVISTNGYLFYQSHVFEIKDAFWNCKIGTFFERIRSLKPVGRLDQPTLQELKKLALDLESVGPPKSLDYFVEVPGRDTFYFYHDKGKITLIAQKHGKLFAKPPANRPSYKVVMILDRIFRQVRGL